MNMKKNVKNMSGEKQYSYGCIMLDFESPFWEAKCKAIDSDDLYIVEGDSSYGLEDECHVTILYGLHDNVRADDVKAFLKPLNLYSANIVGLSLFENPNFDVLKYDICCPQAELTYEEIKRNLDNTQTYDTYKAHMTVAYLKKGMGKKYLEHIAENVPLTPYRFSLSMPNSEKVYFDEINL